MSRNATRQFAEERSSGILGDTNTSAPREGSPIESGRSHRPISAKFFTLKKGRETFSGKLAPGREPGAFLYDPYLAILLSWRPRYEPGRLRAIPLGPPPPRRRGPNPVNSWALPDAPERDRGCRGTRSRFPGWPGSSCSNDCRYPRYSVLSSFGAGENPDERVGFQSSDYVRIALRQKGWLV